jgi:hypothetical protein
MSDSGERVAAQEIDDESGDHADSGGAEAPVPTGCGVEATGGEPGFESGAFGEKPADQRGHHGPNVDAHVEE